MITNAMQWIHFKEKYERSIVISWGESCLESIESILEWKQETEFLDLYAFS